MYILNIHIYVRQTNSKEVMNLKENKREQGERNIGKLEGVKGIGKLCKFGLKNI